MAAQFSRRKVLDLTSTIAALLAAIAVLTWVGREWWIEFKSHERAIPADPISLDGAVLRGSPQARLVVLEYSDFECPFCGTFARESMPRLISTFVDAGIARVGFVQHPLEKLHPHAFGAAEAALCADRQGKFWDMHDLLFSDQDHLDRASLESRAARLALDLPAFRTCLNGHVTQAVRAGIKQAEAVGLLGTPAFLVGRLEPDGRLKVTKAISGGRAYDDLAAALRQAQDGGVSPWMVVYWTTGVFAIVVLLWWRVGMRQRRVGMAALQVKGDGQ